LRRRRGEIVDDDGDGGGGGVTGASNGDDNRGNEKWLTGIEEVAVAPEVRMQNIEETERAKRAMLEYARSGARKELAPLKPSHIEVKESKKRSAPSETAEARKQFAFNFGGGKREREQAKPENIEKRNRNKAFFKKQKKKKHNR
jgi:deoxyribodipyrimidine photo-lyase